MKQNKPSNSKKIFSGISEIQNQDTENKGYVEINPEVKHSNHASIFTLNSHVITIFSEFFFNFILL